MKLTDSLVTEDKSSSNEPPPSTPAAEEDRDHTTRVDASDMPEDEEHTSTLEENEDTIPTPAEGGRLSPMPKFTDRKTRRRQEQDMQRGRNLFNTVAIMQFLRGRYRAVWRERRRTLSVRNDTRYVIQYEPDVDLPEDEAIDFVSMMRDAVEEFERGDRGGRQSSKP